MWPWILTTNHLQALIWLIMPHMFLRFIGLNFLMPGVVSGVRGRSHAQYPPDTGILPLGCLSILAVDWKPGSLGARFYIVTAIVPPPLVSHALIFAFC